MWDSSIFVENQRYPKLKCLLNAISSIILNWYNVGSLTTNLCILKTDVIKDMYMYS